MGFLDVGAYFPSMQGKAPDFTYGGKSRLDYMVCNSFAVKFLQDFYVDPGGFTDHGSLHVALNVPTVQSSRTAWSMPCDVASIAAVMSRLSSVSIPTHTQTEFVQSVVHEDVDKAFQVFCRTFEDACEQCSKDAGLGPLLPKYSGRGKALLRKIPSSHFQVSFDGTVLTDQRQFRSRQKCVRQFRELHHSLKASNGAWTASSRHLWHTIRHSKSFPGGFAQWVVDNDLVSEVPDLPGIPWMQLVLSGLRCCGLRLFVLGNGHCSNISVMKTGPKGAVGMFQCLNLRRRSL